MSWDDLNRRRIQLIGKLGSLCPKEVEELQKLQDIAALIRDYHVPKLKPELEDTVNQTMFDWSSFNPDAVTSPEELDSWAQHIMRSDLQQITVDMWGNDWLASDVDHKEAVRAVIQIYLYLVTKAQAMRCRLNGKIDIAMRHEEVCGIIYNRLPNKMKW